jgi:uncharacterized protein YjbI with pentapeptide repeats
MEARLRSWRQQIKIHPARTIFTALLAVVFLLIILIILGYIFNWGWTGLNGYKNISTVTSSPPTPKITTTTAYQPGKTLWDWLQLLIIPAVLAVAGYVINLSISRGEQAATEQRAKSESEAAEKRAKTEREIALDNQREAALQAYLDTMSELLLEKKLRESAADGEIRTIARVRTLTALRRLDAIRKGNVIIFLYESSLINRDKCTISLRDANLRKVNLGFTDLSGIDLSGANLAKAFLNFTGLSGANLTNAYMESTHLIGAHLIGAHLIEADLSYVDLRDANLYKANLTNVYLSGADLSGANLSGAKVTEEQLKEAISLQGATMPDGSIHP